MVPYFSINSPYKSESTMINTTNFQLHIILYINNDDQVTVLVQHYNNEWKLLKQQLVQIPFHINCKQHCIPTKHRASYEIGPINDIHNITVCSHKSCGPNETIQADMWLGNIYFTELYTYYYAMPVISGNISLHIFYYSANCSR